MKNQSIGGFLIALGWIITAMIVGILYYLNIVTIWLSEAIGISGEASFGVQVIVMVLGLLLLSSAIIFAIVLMILGIGCLKNITAKKLMGKIHRKFSEIFSMIVTLGCEVKYAKR